MGFVVIIEYQTSRIEELQALGKEFREQSAQATGVAKPLRGTVTADQDRSGYYLSIVEFESAEAAEAAMEASSRPETQEFFGRLSGLMDGPVTGIGHRAVHRSSAAGKTCGFLSDAMVGRCDMALLGQDERGRSAGLGVR